MPQIDKADKVEMDESTKNRISSLHSYASGLPIVIMSSQINT